MKNFLKKIMNMVGIAVTSSKNMDELQIAFNKSYDLQILKIIKPEYVSNAIVELEYSKSQLRQDLIVLSELNFKYGGFFVEFGATNGVNKSNSYILEKRFGWKGILAEPGTCWLKELKLNRNCAIDNRCVWTQSGLKMEFIETRDGELSTLEQFQDVDIHASKRKEGQNRYLVETVTLSDLLEQYNAPKRIDYLSIDTEGSEYEILTNFNLNSYDIKFISIEHNFSNKRQLVLKLMESYGYRRIHTELSKFDDWYVK